MLKGETMKVLKKMLFVSVAATGLLIACPDMHMSGKGEKNSGLKPPHGILEELYVKATTKQKRDLLQIDHDFHKAVKAQTEKFREYRDAVEFDIKNLKLDLEEASLERDTTRATEILHRIAKKQEEIRKSKQDEKNLRSLLEEDKIKKMHTVLKVK